MKLPGFLRSRLSKRLVTSTAYAALLLFFLLIWNRLGIHLVLSETFAKTVHLGNALVRQDEKLPFKNSELLFIDFSERLQLVENADCTANYPIASRPVLTKLLDTLEKNGMSDSYVICDLYFDNRSDDDLMLEKEIAKFPNFFSTEFDDKNFKIKPNVFKVGLSAPAGFEIKTESLAGLSQAELSYGLVYGHATPTLPLAIFQHYNNARIEYHDFYYRADNRYFLKTVEIDPYIETGDLDEAAYDHDSQHNNISDREIDYFKIDTLLKDLSYSDLNKKLAQKKIIVIGNFKEDTHNTIAGDLPGPLVVFNIFLSLQGNANQVTLAGTSVLFLVFISLVYTELFLKHKRLYKSYHRSLRNLSGHLALNISLNVLLAWVASLLSYYLINSSLDVIVGASLLSAIGYINRNAIKLKHRIKSAQQR